MKSLFAILLTTLSLGAYANEIKLPKDALRLVQIEEGRVLRLSRVVPKCIPGRPCRPFTRAVVRLPLMGCVDALGPVSYTVSRDDDDSYVVEMLAYNVVRKASESVKCIRAPTADVAVDIGDGDIKLSEIRLDMNGLRSGVLLDTASDSDGSEQ